MVLPYIALTGTCGQIGDGLQGIFALSCGVSIDFKRETRTLKFVQIVQKAEFVALFCWRCGLKLALQQS